MRRITVNFERKRCLDTLFLAMVVLAFFPGPSQAQCKKGQQTSRTVSQITGTQTSQIQQMLMLLQTQQQFNNMISLQQQQNAFLNALQKQRQQNQRLIGLLTTPQYNSQNPFAIQTNTSAQDQQLNKAIQAALQQTQYLINLLQQQNTLANQTLWLNALQQQYDTLAAPSSQES